MSWNIVFRYSALNKYVRIVKSQLETRANSGIKTGIIASGSRRKMLRENSTFSIILSVWKKTGKENRTKVGWSGRKVERANQEELAQEVWKIIRKKTWRRGGRSDKAAEPELVLFWLGQKTRRALTKGWMWGALMQARLAEQRRKRRRKKGEMEQEKCNDEEERQTYQPGIEKICIRRNIKRIVGCRYMW